MQFHLNWQTQFWPGGQLPFDHKTEEDKKFELPPKLRALAACSLIQREKTSVLALRCLQSGLQSQIVYILYYMPY